MAAGAVQYQMITELAAVYGVEITSAHVKMIGTQMIQMLLKTGLVEASTSLIAGLFKSTLVGYAAGGAVQAVSMAYLAHVSGHAFADYFRRGQSWGDGGMGAALIRQFDLNSRAEFLQEFAQPGVEPGRATRSSRRPRPRPAGGPAMNLFPDGSRDDRGDRPGRPRRRSGRPSTSSRAAWPGSRSGSRRSTPGSSSTARGRWAEARELDRDSRKGQDRGPLHGIPFGIKDIIDVAGLPTAAGARAWAEGPAEEDAEIVARLRDAGAVILGKTVTTPYAWVDPPPTRNPWDLGRTPGGSSSGSAVAVAYGMCLGAVGTQTGGSLTRPAAFCGVASFKPTDGLWFSQGIVPLAPSLDTPGFIARDVGDLSTDLGGDHPARPGRPRQVGCREGSRTSARSPSG